jgi:hypothetical protein
LHLAVTMFVGFLRLGCAWILDGGLTNDRQLSRGYHGKNLKYTRFIEHVKLRGQAFQELGRHSAPTSGAVFLEIQPPWALHYT